MAGCYYLLWNHLASLCLWCLLVSSGTLRCPQVSSGDLKPHHSEGFEFSGFRNYLIINSVFLASDLKPLILVGFALGGFCNRLIINSAFLASDLKPLT